MICPYCQDYVDYQPCTKPACMTARQRAAHRAPDAPPNEDRLSRLEDAANTLLLDMGKLIERVDRLEDAEPSPGRARGHGVIQP